MMLEAKRLESIKEYYFSRKLAEVADMNRRGEDVLNLGIGNPDYAPSSIIVDALRTNVLDESSHGYQSYSGVFKLREAIASWTKRLYGVSLNPDTEILPLIGSKEGIMHVSQAFVNAGDEVLVPNPGYPTYVSVSNIVNAIVIGYTVDPSSGINVKEIEKTISDKTKIMWLNMPHMPTGTLNNRKDLKQLITLAKERNFIIVNDNPYSTIMTADYFSIFQIEGAKEVCLELNSLSKSHNMAGWRVGWISGNSSLIKSVLKVKSNMDSGMFLPLQLAAVKALSLGENWIQELNEKYQKRKNQVCELLDALGCTYNHRNAGLFVWARIPVGERSGEDYANIILQEFKLFVTPGVIFGSNGDRYIRVSLCVPDVILSEAVNRVINNNNKL